ncbi:heme-dependent oxidative N-demethylase family protein [Marinibacterium profundimaris]|uniref:DUF3445 domain-containing protein n=1 Tax=Marinibacterium profundimaris TaxID=1679460 RepID=A0A225NYZ7_9RHOB|nr:DUF3445 domain-containing protein [Marinibacterium profundimaris]OWU77356.1 hypothetical protein ATO3_01160 [Marinibacterium profundimaris]
MTAVLQTSLPYDHRARPPLPGIKPLGDAPWLIRDEAHAGQMAERDRLLRDHRDKVCLMDERARPAAKELLDMVLDDQFPGAGEVVTRADGVTVAIDRGDPMGTLGRLVQEDFCILERGEAEAEHVLTAGVLCFPASWTLSEKFMRPLVRIHVPVASYDDGIARRVQRLFDGIQPGRPLWRFNVLNYADPTLFQPLSESAKRDHRRKGPFPYLRSERQSLVRLPRTRAVAFTIHTYVLATDALE